MNQDLNVLLVSATICAIDILKVPLSLTRARVP